MITKVWCRWVVCVGCMAAVAAADEPLRFLRVHVPHGKLAEVDLGPGRYVPMSAKEFEAAVTRIHGADVSPTALAGFGGMAEQARYEVRLETDAAPTAGGSRAGATSLAGTASWTTSAPGVPGRSMPVEGLRVGRAWMRTAAGTGDALVFGRPDGTLAIATPEPGDYFFEWRCGLADRGAAAVAFRLPLVPALATTVEVQVPAGLKPLVEGAVAERMETATVAGDQVNLVTWRFDVGPRPAVGVVLQPDDGGAPTRVRAWTDVAVRGREVRLATLIVPIDDWRPVADGPTFALDLPGGLIITDVRMDDGAATPAVDWRLSADGGSLEITVPTRCLGSRAALVVEALAPMEWRARADVPLLQVRGRSWAGGGIVVRVDPALVIARIDTKGCLVVPPEVASRWPTPGAGDDEDDGPPGVRPTRVHVECQDASPAVALVIEPRVAQAVIDRTTVVDVSPDAVLGRITCSVGVQRGEAFEVRGRLAKGWVLDTVQLVDADGSDIAPPDWKVIRDGGEGEVRVALAAAVSPGRPITLRLTGHRAGVPPGVDITSSDLDMVRFEGETSAAILAVKTGPEMTIDLDGEESTLDTVASTRGDDPAIRVRLPAGGRAPERVMRLMRRRPPVDARTQVRLTSRDGRLTESFTFECRPQRTDIDSLIIHFSTVMDDRLEWSLLPPAAGTLVARRIAAPDRREEETGEPIADSWIVEISPPARDAVTIRAASTAPFTGPVAVPLAWVEGATKQAGEVSVREAGRFRPRVLNRRLVELPPATDVGDRALATVAEFAFDPAQGRPDDPLPAAELVPGGDGSGDDARAWVWREVNTVWCHASGAVEYETCFEIENHGRATVTLSLPPTMQMQGVLVDGALVAADGGSALGGDTTVDLPVGSRFVTVVVRAAARRMPTLGTWEVDPQGAALDVPVLQRERHALIAPDVAIARAWGPYRLVDESAGAATGWSKRLLGATLRPASTMRDEPEMPAPTAGQTRFGSISEGYRSVALVPVVGRRAGGGLLVVRTDVVSGAAIVAAAVAGALVLLVPVSRLWMVACLGTLAAVGALWVAVPFDGVFRAACWATGAAAVVRTVVMTGRVAAPTSITAAMLLLAMLPVARADEVTDAAAADDSLRVFFTPVDASGAGGETALVPEPLFRALIRGTTEPAAVRTVACEITARLPVTGDTIDVAPWTIVVDVDADAGTAIVIDQGDEGGRVVGPQARVDGAAVVIRSEDDARRARIALPGAGRHRLEWAVRPAVVRRGDVEEFIVAVPCAAAGKLMLAGAADAGTIACEVAPPQGRFHAVAAGGGATGFDIAGAAVVRVSRVVDPRLRLATVVRSVVSRNDVFWDLDACRLVATFDISSPNEVVRSFCVTTTPGLVLAGDVAGVHGVGPQRFLVERAEPVRGGFTVQIPFRMPLADPVGVFPVPDAWIEDAVADSRTTQLVPAPDLSVDVTLPDGVSMAPLDADSSLQGFAWRQDVGRGLTGSTGGIGGGFPGANGVGRALVAVERRRAEPRATQQLAIDFAADHVQLGLLARIDATSTALVEIQVDVPAACIVDRVELVEDRAMQAEAADRGPVDIRWSRAAPGSLLVVAQRPRAGRYRLEVEARLPGRPPARGALTVMRAALPGSVPLVASWRTLEGRGAAMYPTYGEPVEESFPPPSRDRVASGSVELPGGETALVYDLGDLESTATAEPPSAAATATVSGSEGREGRVELADVLLELDGRGRSWGVVQFDVVAAGSSLRLALPAGMRLFEVLVDGRAVAGAPQEDGTWLVPLFDVRWPRSVLAVFAGDTGAPAVDGAPFAIAAPRLVGLPCRMMAWTVRVAPGTVLRVADPARVVDAEAIALQRQSVAERLEDEFIRAIEDATADERPRMVDFARLRRAGAALPAEESWTQAMGTAADGAVRAIVDEPMDAGSVRGLVVRVSRAADPTTGSRAIATLVILAAVAGAWHVARRWPQRLRGSAGRAMAGMALVAGIAWLATFDPPWPGWVLLAAGGLWLMARWLRGGAGDNAGDSTVAQFAPPATPPSWSGASTATFLAPRR